MQATARVIDLTRYRQRREAQRNAELMWNLYVARANLSTWTLMHASHPEALAKARP